MRRTKLISILLSAALLLSMSACDQAAPSPAGAAVSPAVSRAPEDLLPVSICSDEPPADSTPETEASLLESVVDIQPPSDFEATDADSVASDAAVPAFSDTPESAALKNMTFDSLHEAYAQILYALWAGDPGLTGELQYIAIDLNDAPGGLDGTETHALATELFERLSGGQGSAALLELSYDELDLLGYLTGDDGDKWFESGILLCITAKGDQSDNLICFDAMLWRSPLGADYYTDCTLTRSADGSWGGFTCTYYVA